MSKPKSQPVGNTDDSKRGRSLTKTNGVKGTNPVTLQQVAERRGLAPQDGQK